MEGVDWIYRLSEGPKYPEPKKEMVALHQIEKQGHPISIMLTTQKSPPLSGGKVGELIAFCRGKGDRLAVLATCRIGGSPFCGTTPDHLSSLYGKQDSRCFLPVSGLTLENDKLLDESILSLDEQRKFLSGQAYVKRLSKKPPSRKKTK